MSSTCSSSVPAAAAASTGTCSSVHSVPVLKKTSSIIDLQASSGVVATPCRSAPISYEGRVSVVADDSPFHFAPLPQQRAPAVADPAAAAGQFFEEATMLRRHIKAECDILDLNNLHANYASMQTLPMYSTTAFSGGDLLHQVKSEPATPWSYPATPLTPARVPSTATSATSVTAATACNNGRHNDSGISPGNNTTDRSTDCAGDSDGTTAVAAASSSSPFSGGDAESVPGSRHDSHLEDMDDDSLDDEEEDMDDLDMDGVDDDEDDDVVSDALSRLQRALHTNHHRAALTTFSSGGGGGGVVDKATSEGHQADQNGTQQVYQCHLCTYSCNSRFHLQAHLNTHFDVKCPHCDFTARTEGKLRAHVRTAHATSGDENDEGIRVPRVNAQGKIKTFKCKQCDFVAVTKLNFWQHTRMHIKAEKLLTCPKCPFVTEYKHHLEYHMRNHLGSKPFKCPKCSYSCVNKSMLNSHMKSHSNVYQYRCADCAYATKYCHSLKLHLKKYAHASAVAISDTPTTPGGMQGTGDRVVKQRKKRSSQHSKNVKESRITALQQQPVQHQHQHQQPGVQHQQQNGSALVNTVPVSSAFLSLAPAFGNSLVANGMAAYNFPLSLLANNYPATLMTAAAPADFMSDANKKSSLAAPMMTPADATSGTPAGGGDGSHFKCSICDFSTVSKEGFSQHLLAHAAADNRDLANLFGVNDFSGGGGGGGGGGNNNATLTPSSTTPSSPSCRTPAKCDAVKTSFVNSDDDSDDHDDHNDNSTAAEYSTPPPPTTPSTPSTPATTMTTTPATARKPTTPLDLSRDKDDSGAPSSKHRRKGQAFKLERIAVRLQGRQSPHHHRSQSASPIQGDPADDSSAPNSKSWPPCNKSVKEFASASNRENQRRANSAVNDDSANPWAATYQCTYCDIAFKDVVMYTMHMGYHGYQDPFTCNMCGQQTHDKLAFFLHIARSSHV